MSNDLLKISDLREGQAVETRLMVVQKEVRQSKTGSTYLHLIMRDSSGTITAFMWDGFESVAPKIKQGNVVKIKGRTQIYRNSTQLILHKVDIIADENVSQKDFMATTEADTEDLFRDFMNFISTVENPHLKELLMAIFEDPEIADKFKQAPAAKMMHHSYIGGLLEHSLSLAKLCDTICLNYPHLDRDLLVTGACLHDIGKIRELSHEGWLDYSREGRLIGHITIGVQMVGRYAAKVEDFPDELKELLQHMILSHHGEYEYGSPRRPKTREALVLHFIDNLDSHLNGFDLALKDQGEDVAYSRILERYIYDK